ncbi:uncharacterized protein LOC130902796 [Diorhabda carinulata]|uniref:uncharacterized protein LOC130902796 n=1 Tax=Diorhabda carinulata TaxID=1163345 RepID=UPI0025A05102|nr:uncharacterized protein LOC130902796 [Diorhabda carinulata]
MVVMGENKNFSSNHLDQSEYEIPYSYDKIKWKLGETYRIRVGNIYDPSKFWIVHFENELSLFFKYMNSYYETKKEEYRMRPASIKIKRYCAAFTDGAFYRGIIVDIPLFNKKEKQVVVFLFDFGFTNVVTIDNLYFLCEKMYSIPRYAIRARLHGLEPFKTDTWTNKSADTFKEMTQGKILLCVLTEIDPVLRTIFIRVMDVPQFNKIVDIGQVLISEKLAKLTTSRKSKKHNKSRLVSKVRYPYLFPSFEALENGNMPSTVFINESLKQCITSSILFKPYYNFNGVELRD